MVQPEFAQGRGLIGCSVDNLALWRRGGYFADKILMGEKPSKLPADHVTRFKLSLSRSRLPNAGAACLD